MLGPISLVAGHSAWGKCSKDCMEARRPLHDSCSGIDMETIKTRTTYHHHHYPGGSLLANRNWLSCPLF